MGACTYTGRSVFSADGRREMLAYNEPENGFELKLARSPEQTINGYRVKLLKGGFMSKAKKVNGKMVLTLTARANQ